MSVDPRLVQSVRQRLTNIARKTGEDVQRVLVRYAIERLLYRMSLSSHQDRFILKGATLFALWADAPYRSTGDLDLLGRGANAPEALKATFTEIAAIRPEPDDALVYETDRMAADTLRADTKYAGVSLRFDALLGRARLPVMVDIGFGDIVTPQPAEVEFPSLLGMPPARLKSYPPQTVVAEKLEAMVALGLANSRVKDLYDLWAISGAFDFDGAGLVRAVKATFERRGTELVPRLPSMLTSAYVSDPARQQLWRAFLTSRSEIANAPTDLGAMAIEVTRFVEPIVLAAAGGADSGRWLAKQRAWGRVEL